MKGVRCASLEEFRENFDFTNAKDYLRQGRLSRWVRDLGENELADELDELKDGEYSDQTLLDNFIGIFGLEGEKTRLPEPEAPAAEEETLPADVKLDSDTPIVYEGFFPDTPEEPTQENIDRSLRIKATLKIIGEQALLAIPPKMRALVSTPLKITPDTLLDEIFPGRFSLSSSPLDGLASALNKACGKRSDEYLCFKNVPSFGLVRKSVFNEPRFRTVGELVGYLSASQFDDILKKYNAPKLAELNQEIF